MHADGRGQPKYACACWQAAKLKQGGDITAVCAKCYLGLLQILATTADQLKNFAVVYLVDLTEIPDFNTMYELYDPCTVMFFFRNKHIMIDLGTGNNNKINWAMNNKQEFIDIVEVVYRGARKGRGLVVSPKGLHIQLLCNV